MNDRIQEFAKESGLVQYDTDNKMSNAYEFAELVRQDERDACADIADIALLGCERSIRDRVIRAIRSRGKK
jgi:hypothetical protein